MHRDSLFNDSESILNISESILSLFFPRIRHVCTLETIAAASLHRICAVRHVCIAGQCVLPPTVISMFYFRNAFIYAVWNAVHIRYTKLAWNRFGIRSWLPESESDREVPKDSHPYYQMTKRLLKRNWFSSMELIPILVIDSQFPTLWNREIISNLKGIKSNLLAILKWNFFSITLFFSGTKLCRITPYCLFVKQLSLVCPEAGRWEHKLFSKVQNHIGPETSPFDCGNEMNFAIEFRCSGFRACCCDL